MRNYESYILERCLNRLNEEYELVYSDTFKDVLKQINTDVAKDIMDLSQEDNKDIDFNYIDFSHTDGMMNVKSDKKINTEIIRSGNDPAKIRDYNRTPYARKIRPTEIKAGKIIQKLLSLISDKKYSASDIEKFVNKYIAIQNEFKGLKWEIYEGDKIKEAYKSKNYAEPAGDWDPDDYELWSSCMVDKEDRVSGILDLYSTNPDNIKILVQLNDKNEITGRALLWLTDDGRKIMDRIYYLKESQQETFRNWAKENGYYSRAYNSNSNYECRFAWFSPKTDEIEIFKDLSVKLKNYNFEFYPYLDTFKYLCRLDGTIFNSEDEADKYSRNLNNGVRSYITLYGTIGNDFGGRDGLNTVELYNGERVIGKEVVMSGFHDGYIVADTAVKIHNNFDSRYVNDYVEKDVVEEASTKKDDDYPVALCKVDDRYYHLWDCVWSDYHDSWIPHRNSTNINNDNILDDYVVEYKREKGLNKPKPKIYKQNEWGEIEDEDEDI